MLKDESKGGASTSVASGAVFDRVPGTLTRVRSHCKTFAHCDYGYASKPNSLIIRANGRIAKCTVAFDDPKNDVGCIEPDGRLKIDQSKLGYWFRGIYTKDMQVLGCPVYIHPHEAGFKRTIPIAVAA